MMDVIENGQNSPEEELQIKMVVKGRTKQMFDDLKHHYNLGYNAEVIRLLIKREHDRLQEEKT